MAFMTAFLAASSSLVEPEVCLISTCSGRPLSFTSTRKMTLPSSHMRRDADGYSGRSGCAYSTPDEMVFGCAGAAGAGAVMAAGVAASAGAAGATGCGGTLMARSDRVVL